MNLEIAVKTKLMELAIPEKIERAEEWIEQNLTFQTNLGLVIQAEMEENTILVRWDVCDELGEWQNSQGYNVERFGLDQLDELELSLQNVIDSCVYANLGIKKSITAYTFSK